MRTLVKYFNVFSDSLQIFNLKMVEIATLVLLFSFQILVFTEQKPHYLIVVFICILLLLVNLNGYFNYLKFLYLFPLLISVFYYLAQQKPDTPFILSILNYVIIPLVFLNHHFQKFDFTRTMKLFQGFTVFCFFGLLLQVVGIEAPFLDLELAITNDVVKERYGSFAGSTLVLGFYTSISSIYTYYDFIYHKNKSLKNIVLLLISLVSLFLAQSRRYYFFTLVVMFLIYFLGTNKDFKLFTIINKNKWVILLIVTFIIVSFLLQDKVFLFMRIYSTFDFANDASNVLRAIKWLEAIQQFIDHFWFGAGLGDMGAVGKNLQEEDVYEIAVAESYYLKVFVEGGIFFGTAFVCMMIFLLKKAFKLIKDNSTKSFAAYIFIFFFVDCFMSMTMEVVLGSILFWLSVSIISIDSLTENYSNKNLPLLGNTH